MGKPKEMPKVPPKKMIMVVNAKGKRRFMEEKDYK